MIRRPSIWTTRNTIVTVFTLVLTGCGTGIPILPFPILSYAPTINSLPNKIEKPVIEATISNSRNSKRESMLAMRGGRALAVVSRKTDADLLNELPTTELKTELLSFYVPPQTFKQAPAGSRHYFNFEITPEFAAATTSYLAGDSEEALAQVDSIKEGPHTNKNLLWQSSYLKVNILLMSGRPDIAEDETKRTERLEDQALGGNVASRALRAEVRYWAGDIEGAFEDSIQVIKELGDWRFPTRYSSPPRDQTELVRATTAQARANIVLGLALVAKGRHKEALPWLELADQTMNNVMYVSRHPLYGLYFWPCEEVFWGRGMSLIALGSTLMALEPDSPRSTEIIGHARDYFKALGFQAGPVVIESFKAHALASAGKYERAAEQALSGIKSAETLGLLDYIWRLEALRGHALIELGRIDEAEQALRHAQTVVDMLAGTIIGDDDKVRFGVGKEGVMRDLVKIDLKKSNMDNLFDDMERGRARSFVALLASRKINTGKHTEVVSEIQRMDSEIRKERQKVNALSNSKAINTSRQQDLLQQRTILVSKLRDLDPDIADAFAVSAVGLSDVQRVLKLGTLLVYALPGQENTNLSFMFITRETSAVKTFNATGSDLSSLLKSFNSIINTTDSESQRVLLTNIADALDLRSWPKAQEVYFVPTGQTHFIPWGALNINFSVSVLPNGAWVTRTAPKHSLSADVAIIGDPEFGGVLPQLPGARTESQSLAIIYRTSTLIGASATEFALRSKVGAGVDVLHLATHALFDPVYPLKSALILSDGSKAVPLTAEKIYEKPLPARLVVLSACETGMGKIVGGDEMLGLVRSFYLGGASSVLSSLWPVQDEATRLFMETFHKSSLSNSYGKAWLIARDTLREQGFPPAAYGAFILGGSLY